MKSKEKMIWFSCSVLVLAGVMVCYIGLRIFMFGDFRGTLETCNISKVETLVKMNLKDVSTTCTVEYFEKAISQHGHQSYVIKNDVEVMEAQSFLLEVPHDEVFIVIDSLSHENAIKTTTVDLNGTQIRLQFVPLDTDTQTVVVYFELEHNHHPVRGYFVREQDDPSIIGEEAVNDAIDFITALIP